MNLRSQRGDWRFGPIAGLIIVVLAIIGLFAVCFGDDDDNRSLGRTFNEQAVSLTVPIESTTFVAGIENHEDEGNCDWDGDCDGQRYDQNYGSRDDRNRNRNRDRGAFSPGPFRDSPVVICAPYSCNSGGEQSGGNRSDQPPPDERER